MFGRTFNWKGKAFSPILEKNFPNFKNENPCQSCILSPYLFNLYAEYIMRDTGLEEAQAGIKIAGRNINNSHMQMTPPLWQKVKRNSTAS